MTEEFFESDSEEEETEKGEGEVKSTASDFMPTADFVIGQIDNMDVKFP